MKITQSTNLTRISTMDMKSIMLNTNTEDYRISKRQEGVPQWMMQRRMSVERTENDLQLSDQMVEVSNTPRKNITFVTLANDTSENVQGATSDEELEMPKIRICHLFKPNFFFIKAVDKTIEKLKNSWREDNTLEQCICIIKHINKLTIKIGANKDNSNYLEFQIGPLFVNCLGFALDYLKYKANTECSWEYVNDLNLLAEHFYIQPKDSITQLANYNTIRNLYSQFMQNEFNYLEYLKDEFPSNSKNHSFNILQKLLLKQSPYGYFVDKIEVSIYREKIRLLKSMIVEGDFLEVNIQRDEMFCYLEKKVVSETACIKMKRRYHDALQWKIKEKTKRLDFPLLSVCQLVEILSTFKNIHKICVKYLPEFHVSIQTFNKSIISVSKKILLDIKEKPKDMDLLIATSIDIIDDLIQQGLLNEECKRLYDSCTNQSVRRDVDQAKEWTDTSYSSHIIQILELAKSDDYNCNLTSASMLKALLESKEEEIAKMDTADTLNMLIKSTKSILFVRLFKKIINTFYNFDYLSVHSTVMADVMDKFRDKIIDSSQYTFILNGGSYYIWIQIVCMAFYLEMDKISKKCLLSKNDITLLLHLKHIAPHVPNSDVRINLEYSLIQYFKTRLHTDAAHTEVDNELSEWVEYLKRQKKLKLQPELIKIHKQWKMKIMNKSLAKFIDESTTSNFSDGLEQPPSAEMGAPVMPSSSLPCVQAMHQRGVPAPSLTDLHAMHRQLSISTNVQQHLQAPSSYDYEPFVSLTGEGYPFFSTFPIMPLPQYPSLESVHQPASTSKSVQLSQPPPRLIEENSLCSGIQQIYISNLKPMGMNQLPLVENRARQMLAKNMDQGYPLNSMAPAFYSRRSDQSILSNQPAEFISTEGTMQGTILHQYRPTGDVAPEMNQNCQNHQ